MNPYGFASLPSLGDPICIDDLEEITFDGLAGEGDYSSYSLKWNVEVTSDEQAMWENSHFLPDESKIMVIGYHDLLIVNVSDGTFTRLVDVISTGTTYAQYQDFSIFKKYFAFLDWDNYYIYVYKDGVLIHTFEVDDKDTGDSFSGVIVSPSGKYILLHHEDESTSPDEWTLRLYEGS